jgi:hypothetical protein
MGRAGSQKTEVGSAHNLVDLCSTPGHNNK